MDPIRHLSSRTVVLPITDVDTDQIIPARFLTTTSKDGLGRHLFSYWRFNADGSDNADFVLNSPGASDCQILVAGNNFGCGSSREHAPWALLDYGIRAVVSTAIADIFRSNSLKNGLLPIEIDNETHAWLLDHPGVELNIDIADSRLTMPDGRTATFVIDSFARHCLLEGVDQLGFLQQHAEQIGKFEAQRSWTP